MTFSAVFLQKKNIIMQNEDEEEVRSWFRTFPTFDPYEGIKYKIP
jgi:hypothetical protein